MRLDFIEQQRPSGPAYMWRPFGDWANSSPDFDASWWSQRNFLATSRLLRVEMDGVEVARVEIDRDPRRSTYARVPALGLVREIHYIEVSQAFRGQGIGPEVVELLVAESRSARLIASSNTAVGWWSTLPGWDRVDRPEGLMRDWVMFVGPAQARSC